MLTPKTIKWLNYKGEMTGLSNQLSSIRNRYPDKLTVIESRSENIINAYKNDFNTNLLDK